MVVLHEYGMCYCFVSMFLSTSKSFLTFGRMTVRTALTILSQRVLKPIIGIEESFVVPYKSI